MPIINCDSPAELSEIVQNLLCDRGGFFAAFWAKASDIDTDATSYDEVENVVSNWAMSGGGLFHRVHMDRETAQYVSTYSEDSGLYDSIITMLLKGKTQEQTKQITAAIATCGLILHVYNNDCTQRVFGLEWDGEKLNFAVKPLSVQQHVDQGGNLTGERSSDQMTLNSKHLCAAPHATVPIESMPTA